MIDLIKTELGPNFTQYDINLICWDYKVPSNDICIETHEHKQI